MTIADPVAPVELPSEAELSRFDGQWVAVSEGKVIASGKTARAVRRSAATLGVETPIILHVPLSSPTAAFY